MCAVVEKMCELGATDREVADFLGVTDRTLYRWRHEHEDFCQALKVGKNAFDNRVERALGNRAVGYSFDSEKIMCYEGQVIRAPCVEHVPPDTTAAIFWLKNRRREQWSDKVAPTPPIGPGLTVVIQQVIGGATTGSVPAHHVEVKLPAPG